MSTSPIAAMATWVGALARGGLLMGRDEEEGAMLAYRVLGEASLSALRVWFAGQERAVVERERRGAIHACIWMAQADREITDEEVALLKQVIVHSDLPRTAQDELLLAIDEPREAASIAEELTQPGLRELVLALTQTLAGADDRVDEAERSAQAELARAFGISADRVAEITEAVEGK